MKLDIKSSYQCQGCHYGLEAMDFPSNKKCDPSYIHRKLKEKQKQKKSLGVYPPTWNLSDSHECNENFLPYSGNKFNMQEVTS